MIASFTAVTTWFNWQFYSWACVPFDDVVSMRFLHSHYDMYTMSAAVWVATIFPFDVVFVCVSSCVCNSSVRRITKAIVVRYEVLKIRI